MAMALPFVIVALMAQAATLVSGPFSDASPQNTVSSRRIRLARSTAVLSQPSPRERINPTVSMAVTHDPVTHLYRYELTVSNASNAQNSIAVFGVADVEEPDSADAPAEWIVGYGFEDRARALVWHIADTLTSPPPDPLDINVYK